MLKAKMFAWFVFKWLDQDHKQVSNVATTMDIEDVFPVTTAQELIMLMHVQQDAPVNDIYAWSLPFI